MEPPQVPSTPDGKSFSQSILPAPLPSSTFRRNPPRRVRHQDPAVDSIPPFPVHELSSAPASESLRVFLRIRPLDSKSPKGARGDQLHRPRGVRNAKPKPGRKKNEVCLVVNDSSSVTLVPPPSSLVDPKRAKSELYEGFNHVFPPESTQLEVYAKVASPLVRDFIDHGKSGLLAALGPTGSGKTYTMFGTPRNPGIVTLALQEIFSSGVSGGSSDLARSYLFSMFEISCERGKGEKIIDLTPSGSEAFLQQTMIRGLQEIVVSSVVDAECLIARGMMKRATSMTNANNQSSRSHCVISYRQVPVANNGERDVAPPAVFTFIDLAGAERERKTGIRGAKLMESGFINNTSMVLGHCLRSLIEHQKNPKKQLQKHFQNSLLTRYLRDHLEGKKRFTLILNAKPGELDYPETSCLLRQASPYMHIKFLGVEEVNNASCQKRPGAPANREPAKRRNYGLDLLDDAKSKGDDFPSVEKEETVPTPQKAEINISSSMCPGIPCEVDLPEKQGTKFRNKQKHSESVHLSSEQIMRGLSKALWNVLKQYKQKLEASELEVRALQESLRKESSRALQLEKEMEQLKISDLQAHDISSASSEKVQSECHPPSALPCTMKEKSAFQDNAQPLELPGLEVNISSVSDGQNLGEVSSVMEGETIGEGSVRNSKPPKPEKPKRQLLPASAILLKGLRGIEVETETTEVSEVSEKKEMQFGRQRSRGSIALLSILKSAGR